MLGAGAVKPKDTAEERAKNVFLRFVDNLIMIMIDRVVHSYWSRSFKILSSECSNLIILVGTKVYAITTHLKSSM